MKVFICDDHAGIWLSGASVVVAADEHQAREMLAAELEDRKIKASEFTLKEMQTTHPKVFVLFDGNY